MPNIFVLGMDEANEATLEALPDASEYRFHQLLTLGELRHGPQIPVKDLLAKAREELDAFAGDVDAIIGFWDFPITQMAAVLNREYDLRWPALEAVLKCEHKYWSRLVQQEVIDDVPRFDLIDLDASTLPAHLTYPVWVKPVKSASSASAYYAADDSALHAALSAERRGVGRFGKPFDYLLSLADVPNRIAEVGGQACLVEELATGSQVTVEGYSRDGHVKVYGAVDSITYPDSPSFLRYQYPSALPEEVLTRLSDISRRVVTHIGLDNSTFNIEYFWDSERQAIKLLEINPRHSQSHAMLFEMVDGLPNHKCMIDLALGREPDLPRREGPYTIAAKWFPRMFYDGVVRRSPTEAEITTVEADVPGVSIEVIVGDGDRLCELPDQDSYSYGIANIHVGAGSERELIDKYQSCLRALPFEIAQP